LGGGWATSSTRPAPLCILTRSMDDKARVTYAVNPVMLKLAPGVMGGLWKTKYTFPEYGNDAAGSPAGAVTCEPSGVYDILTLKGAALSGMAPVP